MDELSARQKVGLVLAGTYGAVNTLSVATPAPADAVGPPMVVLVLDSVLGVVALVAAIVAWRTGSRATIRVVAGALVIIAVTALPAFFVDVPAWIKLLVAVTTMVTIAIVVLLLSPARRAATLEPEAVR